LWKHARRASDPRQVSRLLSLAAVYEGRSRAEAASIGGMDRQTLRDWVLRFNADGPDGWDVWDKAQEREWAFGRECRLARNSE
jgi:transposase